MPSLWRRPASIATRWGLSASVAVAVVATPGALAAGAQDRLVPQSGVLVGTSSQPRSGRSPLAELHYLERRVGRTFDIDHRYSFWNDAIPGRYTEITVSQGRIPLITWVAHRRGGFVSWRSIASGAHDRWLRVPSDALASRSC
jgi:hypothetical protein